MKRAISSVIAVILLLTAIRQGAILAQNQQHATPPEVKRTVEAFLGHWVLAVRDTELGAKVSAHFEITIDCKPAALGAAVNCIFCRPSAWSWTNRGSQRHRLQSRRTTCPLDGDFIHR